MASSGEKSLAVGHIADFQIDPKCLSSCGRAKEREKALIVSELRQRYPLKDLLKLSGIARSTYYYYLKQQDKDKYAAAKEDIIEAFEKNKRIYGYRRITDQLKKGYSINHKTVLKLMKSLGLRGKQSKNGKYHSYKGEVGKIADNITQSMSRKGNCMDNGAMENNLRV